VFETTGIAPQVFLKQVNRQWTALLWMIENVEPLTSFKGLVY